MAKKLIVLFLCILLAGCLLQPPPEDFDQCYFQDSNGIARCEVEDGYIEISSKKGAYKKVNISAERSSTYMSALVYVRNLCGPIDDQTITIGVDEISSTVTLVNDCGSAVYQQNVTQQQILARQKLLFNVCLDALLAQADNQEANIERQLMLEVWRCRRISKKREDMIQLGYDSCPGYI